LRVIWVAQVADALTDDLHLVRVLEQPPDGCAFNHFRIAQVRKKSPRRCWLAAVEPANQDKWAIVDHGFKFTSAQALRLAGNVKMLNPLRWKPERRAGLIAAMAVGAAAMLAGTGSIRYLMR
jgi:hypothetical protein